MRPSNWALLKAEYLDAQEPELLPASTTPTLEDTMKYWHARQMFTQEYQQELHSAAQVPPTIEKEWTM